jgi:hypothetical protein
MSSLVASSSNHSLAADALARLKGMYVGSSVCSFNTHSDGDIQSMIVLDKLTLVINGGRYVLITDRKASADGINHSVSADSLDVLLSKAWDAYPMTKPPPSAKQ